MTPRQDEAKRALQAFLRHTAAPGIWYRAQRALTLHMLEGHAPAFFAAQGLSPVLEQAVQALTVESFADDSDERLAMARLDAVYVLRERGLPAEVDGAQLRECIWAITQRTGIYGWLMGELAHQLGLPGRLDLKDPRPLRKTHRIPDLYWLTHLFLLATRYLRRPLPAGFEAMTQELVLAADEVLGHGELDLAAELAFCLVLAGKHEAPERARILAALAAAQKTDGTVEQGDAVSVAHATSAALLAFATAV